MLAMKVQPKTLLIIAPTLYECAHAAKEWGLVPGQIENFRNVTRAIQLRGIRPGTPFISINRGSWRATREGYDLDVAVDTMMRTGHIRIMREDDLPNYRAFDGIPERDRREIRA